jgi:hypothetical protein
MAADDSGPIESKSPRARVYHSIRHIFASALNDYYRRYPERLKDPENETNIDAMLKLMQKIFDELNKYDIHDRPTDAEHALDVGRATAGDGEKA